MQQPGHTRKFLIATHGSLSAGVKSSLDIIIGAMDNVFLIQAYVEENVPVEDELNQVLEQVSDEDELVIFTDILGGSVTNQALQYALRPNVYIISGFNLPLVIEVTMAENDRPVHEIIEE